MNTEKEFLLKQRAAKISAGLSELRLKMAELNKKITELENQKTLFYKKANSPLLLELNHNKNENHL